MKIIYLAIIMFDIGNPDVQSVVIRTEPESFHCESANEYVESHTPPGKVGRAVCMNREQVDIFVAVGKCRIVQTDTDDTEMVYTYICHFDLSNKGAKK